LEPLSDPDPLRDASLVRELAEEWCIFDPFVAGKRRVDLHPLVLPRALHRAAITAAEQAVQIVGRAAAVAFDDGTEAARYRVHASIEALARASHAAGDDASLVRVDLLWGTDGRFHACEVNADCPGGHNESLALPRLAQRVRGAASRPLENPTDLVEALATRLAELADGGAVGIVYATAYAEDLQVCALLRRALAAHGVTAHLAPPTAPRFDGTALRIWDEPVRVLYRYFPIEYMEGQKNLREIEDAVACGAVRTVSSFAELFAQSKLAFARAWALFDCRGSCIPETHDALALAKEDLVRERARWVLKKAFGRVGDDVFVGPLESEADWSEIVNDVHQDAAKGGSWIAQRFVEQAPLPTPWGPRFVTLGAYVLDGRFCGYYARITPDSHVSHDALVVPVFVDSDQGAPA
jgi:glutathionylspermidine synthase